MGEKEISRIRKNNMKLYPAYRMLALDFIFFYSINFLFLTQIKGISASDIVLVDAFYAIFCIAWQIPAAIVVDFIGKKKSMLLGNALNCLYIVLVMSSQSFLQLLLAEFCCSFAFSLKDVAESTLLNNSIPPAKDRGAIFAKLDGKGLTGYYYIKAVTVILAGFLFNINGYLPISLTLVTTIIAFVMSLGFQDIDELTKETKKEKRIPAKERIKEYEKDLKVSMKFILQSKRLKGLLIFCAVLCGFMSLIDTYEITLLEEIQIPAQYIGIIFAVLGIASGKASHRQEQFHQKHTNRSLMYIGLSCTIACILAGLVIVLKIPMAISIIVILLAYLIKYYDAGLFNVLSKKYLRNFSDAEITSKIYASQGLLNAIAKASIALIGAVILNIMSAANAMVLLGVIFIIILIVILKYMKTRVGLKPEEYPEKDISYQTIK